MGREGKDAKWAVFRFEEEVSQEVLYHSRWDVIGELNRLMRERARAEARERAPDGRHFRVLASDQLKTRPIVGRLGMYRLRWTISVQWE